ncbi:MAG: Omp28-related outer membrane protein [Bacteroidales bacterium]|nr:Omp28-related outer membrane protein [Bacteroidales bacterium]MDD4604275.1 Omp28-related outer membrane protein [Bacteroidales bacterium]
MKIFKYITLIGILAGLLFPSCTKVEEPYYTVKSVYADTNMRSVILEDYTGHKCVNCAPAARMAQSIQELYPNQVFVISVHAGSFAQPDSVKYGGILKDDFRCTTGNDWYNYSLFKIDQNPKGMVNRALYNGKISAVPSQWAGAVSVAVKQPKLAILTIKNVYNAGTKSLAIHIGTKFLQGISGQVNLCVCILEDSIYGGQLNSVPGDSIPYYKHFCFMDVLRGSVNGSWGDLLTTDPDENTIITKDYTFLFNTQPTWIPGNCNIVAFLMNSETKEILHAAKMPVVNVTL